MRCFCDAADCVKEYIAKFKLRWAIKSRFMNNMKTRKKVVCKISKIDHKSWYVNSKLAERIHSLCWITYICNIKTGCLTQDLKYSYHYRKMMYGLNTSKHYFVLEVYIKSKSVKTRKWVIIRILFCIIGS